ncbi:hypothetical protein D3C71_1704940 [compost metagenome]
MTVNAVEYEHNHWEENKGHPHVRKLGDDENKGNRQGCEHAHRVNDELTLPAYRLCFEPVYHHAQL